MCEGAGNCFLVVSRVVKGEGVEKGCAKKEGR